MLQRRRLEEHQRVLASGGVGVGVNRCPIISERLPQPTPKDIRRARNQAGLTQTQAAQLVSTAQTQPYRTWQSYEVEAGKPGHRAVPMAAWELFLLLTEQHPTHRLVPRRAGAETRKRHKEA